MTRPSLGRIYHWQLTWNWLLTFNILVRLPSNRLRNLSTCNRSTQTLRNNIQQSQLPWKAHQFYCACGCTPQLEILPWSLSMAQVIRKKRGRKKFGWFKVGRSIIIGRNQAWYNQNGVREPKKRAMVIFNSCKAFIDRKSPRNPHKPTTSLALSQPPLLPNSGSNSTAASTFYS